MALLFIALGILIGSELFDLLGIKLSNTWSSLFMALDLTYGPLLWLLTVSFLNKNRGLKKTDLWHFLPFLIVLILLNSSFASSIYPTGDGITSNALFAFVCFKLFLIFSYLLALHKKLRLTTPLNPDERLFIKYVIWSSTFVFAISYGVFFIMYTGVRVPIDSDYLACILVTFLVYLLTFLILRSPGVFFEKRRFGPKYSKSNIGRSDMDLLLSKLNILLQKEKVFLNENLNLTDLAQQLDISPNILSQVINEGMNKTFNDLINEHRVEFVKQKLSDPKEDHKKILALAFESGFQSKASFNRIFKKQTGMTPVQFKLLNRSHPTQ